MHEGVVFVAIIAAVIFTGIVGAFIIVPVLASAGVIGRYIHARLLGLPAFEDEMPASASDSKPAPTRRVTDRSNRKPARAATRKSETKK